jgi:CubicO group peptidase (beta-lactamase class C family)
LFLLNLTPLQGDLFVTHNRSFDDARLARLDKHLARYVDDGRLAGWQLALTHRDSLVHEASYGWRDREAGLPVESDTIWRIASMTKPITSVCAMTLWEEGVFELTDPISKWLPAFEDVRVYDRGVAHTMVTVPATEPIRVWHLLSHTSGLTAGFMRMGIVDQLYREAGYEFGAPAGHDLAACVDDWARLPLLFQPGSAWGYGVSTDVLGRLIEIWTGQTLDVAFRNRVFEPLGMVDTGFWCDPAQQLRVSALYYYDEQGLASRITEGDAVAGQRPAILSGGGGLVSTTADYVRFTQMLVGEGALEGTRIVAPATIRLMASNHLSGDLASLSTGGFAETSFDGVGFGLGFAVLDDPVRLHSPASRGEFYWGGIFSTAFWADPVEDVGCVFMAQLMPSSAHPIRSQLRQLVYSALV